MKYKKGFIFVCLIICLFSIAGVVASDVNETAVASDSQSDEPIEIENQNDEADSVKNAEDNVVNDLNILKSSESDNGPAAASSSSASVLKVGDGGEGPVVKKSSVIAVKNIKGHQGKKVKLTATIRDNFGNPVKGCVVSFKLNGKTYNAKTNSKGIAAAKVKIPKSKLAKISSKTKGNIVTKISMYKKTYSGKASVSENGNYKDSSANFKVISENKKTQKYRIVKKQRKTITIPYKKWGLRKKTSGHYIFGILHEQQEGNRISVAVGDKTLRKYIKFSSNAFYISHGKKVYPWKWIKSKHNDDIHEYYYTGDAKIYVIIKYTANTYKKI